VNCLRLGPLFNANEDFIPFMVLAGGIPPAPGETSRQHLAVSHSRHINPAPSGKAAHTLSSDLITEESDDSLLDAVVVRLRYPFLAFVFETHEMLRLNGCV